ncbi:hypothetical protein [Bradyrhizobium sp. HKCCYLR20261]|uniref:hypothetical protein n=1 Tax=Bradyrhizobium sp. HKCCYLR20261 TaxID=3420760 RepID=UPI003EBB854D
MAARKATTPARSRVPKGKKQMLCILDEDVIKRIKMAAIEDGTPMSHAVEKAIREWLARRPKPPRPQQQRD